MGRMFFLVKQLEDDALKYLDGGDIVTLVTGAGLSVSSGIPPYRGTSNAVWESSVQEWGTKKKFIEDPLVWYNHFWLPKFAAKNVINAKPNIGHLSISELQMKYPNLYVITQNIDGLHLAAGSPSNQLIQVHGQLGYFKCINEDCDNSSKSSIFISKDDMLKYCDNSKKRISSSSSSKRKLSNFIWNNVPKCNLCNSFLMPQTLMFDETYESHVFYEIEKAKKWCEKSKLMIFIGTSHNVNITTTAEQIGYQNNIHLYNINLHDSVNGMININMKAEIILSNLKDVLLNNYTNIDEDESKKKKKKISNYSLINIKEEESKIIIKESNIIQELFINRTLPLSIIENDRYIDKYKILYFKYDTTDILLSCNSLSSISSDIICINPLGMGSWIGDKILNEFDETIYNNLIDKTKYISSKYNRSILLHSLMFFLDEKASVRNIHRIKSSPKLPRALWSFIQRKKKLAEEKKKKLKKDKKEKHDEEEGDSDKESNDDKKRILTDNDKTEQLCDYMKIDNNVCFCFNEEKFLSFSSKNFGVEIQVDGSYKYIGSASKLPLYIVPITEDYWNIIVNDENDYLPYLKDLYYSFEEFHSIGGIGYCIVDNIVPPLSNEVVLSICISTIISKQSHRLFMKTHPALLKCGLASACGYCYVHHCIKEKIIPEITCNTENSNGIRIGCKLGFIPTAIIPNLNWSYSLS